MYSLIMNFLTKLIRRIRGRYRCKTCSSILGYYGYCEACNDWPYRKWLTEEEVLWWQDVEEQRAKEKATEQ